MDPLSLKIYSSKDTPRLNYIAGLILGDILGLSWEITTDRRKLGKHPVINYSSVIIKGSFRIDPVSILFETGTCQQEIVMSEWKSLPVFFLTPPGSDIPFDIFAASFFLVSRYEEYLQFQADQYGRYTPLSSVAFRNGFLDKPVVDLWVKEFAKALLKMYPVLVFKRIEYNSLLTIDTDQAFAYRGRNVFRSVGGFFRDITLKTGKAGERYKVVAKGKKDPFEVFEYIIESIERNNTEARFFFPVGDYSRYDKNPSWKNEEYRKLIKMIAGRFMIGLHPSFRAADSPSLITSELNRLKSVVKKDILISRFHYLRLFTPRSYRYLTAAGISGDFSMGYPDEPGFRAGIARPYFFYDVEEDRQTSLKIVPFQVMDCTLYQYKNLNPDHSLEVIIKLVSETRKAGGLFVSIWHNTSLLADVQWSTWRDVFQSMLQIQKQ